ncbi:RDD family protein [Chryseobacterium sp.]|uniref:RDD family protein n=1 Tax=Chryseobacterium sp. TaxID=1871047 RepID=UPI00289DC298|nr:RDD family protein [Chryseobacterium sp.]
MKISDLKERRIIRRATRDFDLEGNRIYNEFEYDFTYNPTEKGSERERLYAKLIDLSLFILFFCFILSKTFVFLLFFSIAAVLISGSISETFFGTTLGKKIFKLKVIDEQRDHPRMIRSICRNILSFANFWPVFSDFEPEPNQYWAASGTRLNFSMHLNNQITKTFIVKESKIQEKKNA